MKRRELSVSPPMTRIEINQTSHQRICYIADEIIQIIEARDLINRRRFNARSDFPSLSHCSDLIRLFAFLFLSRAKWKCK